MNLRMKSIAGLSSVIIGCVVYVFTLQRTYYFNPLTFRRDAVTPYAWTEYKKPMELDVVYQPGDGSMFRYVTQNRSEIEYVVSQLKMAQLEHTPFPNVSGQTILELRNPVSGEDYLDASLPSHSKFVFLFNQNAVALSPALQAFINDKRKSAKRTN